MWCFINDATDVNDDAFTGSLLSETSRSAAPSLFLSSGPVFIPKVLPHPCLGVLQTQRAAP